MGSPISSTHAHLLLLAALRNAVYTCLPAVALLSYLEAIRMTPSEHRTPRWRGLHQTAPWNGALSLSRLYEMECTLW